jgi:predicted lactoylglutathione lyase
MVKQIFVNLPVRDLQASKDFFGKLGFTFNEQFTDENAACMVIGENLYAMLLVEPFFQTFIKKEIADATKTTEVLNALSVESREEVDEMMAKALEAGATEPREPQDQGFMYNRAFEDLDGHIWEVFYMDMSQMPESPEA